MFGTAAWAAQSRPGCRPGHPEPLTATAGHHRGRRA
ncbi:phage DNA packaging protein J [Micromonospora sp. NPDC053740]